MPKETFSIFYGKNLQIQWNYKEYDDTETISVITIPIDDPNFLLFTRIAKILVDKLNIIDDSISEETKNRKIVITEGQVEKINYEVPKPGDIIRLLNTYGVILYKIKVVSYDDNDNPIAVLMCRIEDSALYKALMDTANHPVLRHVGYPALFNSVKPVIEEKFPDDDWMWEEKETIKIPLEDIVPIENPVGLAKWDYKIKKF